MGRIDSKLMLLTYRLAPALVKRVGPHGETLAAVSLGVAIALPLLVPEWWKLAVYVSVTLFVLSAYFFLAALGHARMAQRESESGLREQEKIVYQVTPTRVMTLEASGVPNDITGVLKEKLEAIPHGKAIPSVPMNKRDFLLWLSRDLGLGRTRIEEFKDKILRYAEYDGEWTPPPGMDGEAGVPPVVQVVPNGGGLSHN